MSVKRARASAIHAPPLPELPDECIRLILKFACEAAVAERVIEFKAVFATANDIFKNGTMKLKTDTFESVSRHMGVVAKDFSYIFKTLDLHQSELRGMCICKRDDVIVETCTMEPSSKLLICDEVGDESGEWDDERLSDDVFDINLKPCFSWGRDVKLPYSIALCRELSARVHIEAVRVPTRAFSTSTEVGRWGVAIVASDDGCHERICEHATTEFFDVVDGWARV
jgi:hypothetical protein